MRVVSRCAYKQVNARSICLLVAALLYSLLSTHKVNPKVYVALVSNKVPQFGNVSWMITLAVRSFLISFPISSDNVRLAVYVECAEQTSDATRSLDRSAVSTSRTDYVLALKESLQQFTSEFRSIDYYCTSSLGQAVCHARMVMPTLGIKDGMFFLLEHDWVLMPSQMTASLTEIHSAMRSGSVEYVLLQRGDRKAYSRTQNNPNLRETDMYSNNPFFSSLGFLARVTDNTHLCSQAHDPKWERLVEAHCKLQRCKTAVLQTKKKGAAIYHVDGRYLSTASKYGLGPLFNALNEKTKNFQLGQLSATELITAIDLECRTLNHECDPYFHRRAFSTLLRPLVEEMAGTGTTLEQVIERLTGEAAGQFLQGKFVKRDEFDHLLRKKFMQVT